MTIVLPVMGLAHQSVEIGGWGDGVWHDAGGHMGKVRIVKDGGVVGHRPGVCDASGRLANVQTCDDAAAAGSHMKCYGLCRRVVEIVDSTGEFCVIGRVRFGWGLQKVGVVLKLA
jgi:hypothetical protein